MGIYRGLNLALAFLLELAAFAALGYGGANLDGPTWLRVLLAIVLPILGIGLWALFAAAAKPLVPVPSWVKILVKVLVYGGAAVLLFVVGARGPAIVLAVLVVVNTALIRLGRLDEGVVRPS